MLHASPGSANGSIPSGARDRGAVGSCATTEPRLPRRQGDLIRFARLAALAGVVLAMFAAPLTAETQQAGKVRPYRVGVLHPAFGEITPAVQGLKAGLKAAGLEEGRDVIFEIRYTRGEVHALPAAASALSVGGVDLIFTVGEAAARAAIAAT